MGASDQRRRQQQQWLDDNSMSKNDDGNDKDNARTSVFTTATTTTTTSANNPLYANDDDEDGGGVEGSPASVLVNYFLKSHGGAHALQCLCSLLASSAGVASLALSSSKQYPRMKVTLLKRTMLFAMIKHVSGLFAAVLVAARAIPEVGLRKSRMWMEQLALDPVSQYIFYAACVLLWLPSTSPASASSGRMQNLVMFSPDETKLPWITAILVGPILLREIVSTILVISDVLVLWVTTSTTPSMDESEKDGNGQRNVQVVQTLLQIGRSTTNAFMSLLVTPTTWRSADPAMRQQILAKLTSQVSLILEVLVGVIMLLDAIGRVGQWIFGTATVGDDHKPLFLDVVKRLICARIYLQFLWRRKRKIHKLVTNIRGGSSQLPFHVLDILMDPFKSMGLEKPKTRRQHDKDKNRDFSWSDYLMEMMIGMNEE